MAPSPRRARRQPTRVVLVTPLVALLAVIGLLATPGCTDDGDDTLSTEEFCEQLDEQRALVGVIGNLETTQLEGSGTELSELAARAPEDIRTDMIVLADAVEQVVEALESVESGDVGAAEEAIRPLQEDLAPAQEAGVAVEDYARDRCGLDLRTGATVATTVPVTGVPPDGSGTGPATDAPTTDAPTTDAPTTDEP